MVSDATIKLATFSLLLNIIFPVFAYSFTTLEGEDIQNWDLSIDLDDLLNAGIQFDTASQQNITFNGDPVTFNTSDKLTRFTWQAWPLAGDQMRIRHPSFVEMAWGDLTGDYWLFGGVETAYSINGELVNTGVLYNSTIVTNWDTSNNWTRIDLKNMGLTCLITPRPNEIQNITQAVYVDGNLTLTMGQVRTQDGEFDAGEFVDFYWDMLIGSNDWGLPSSMAWIVRILTVITMFSAILLGRELLNPLS